MKTLTVREVSSIKNTAKSVLPLTIKKAKLMATIVEATEELEKTNKKINLWEAAVIDMTDGYTSEDLIIRSVEVATDENGNTKVDKNGTPVKNTKWEPNPAILVYNEDKGVYEIVDPVEEVTETPNIDEEAKVEETINNEFNPADVATPSL